MMTALRDLDGDAIAAALESRGFERVWRRGSHVRFVSEAGRVVTTPLFASEPVCVALLRKILRDADLGTEEFAALLERDRVSPAKEPGAGA